MHQLAISGSFERLAACVKTRVLGGGPHLACFLARWLGARSRGSWMLPALAPKVHWLLKVWRR